MVLCVPWCRKHHDAFCDLLALPDLAAPETEPVVRTMRHDLGVFKDIRISEVIPVPVRDKDRIDVFRSDPVMFQRIYQIL